MQQKTTFLYFFLLFQVQILNYERSSGGDWLLLRGIKKDNNAIVGKLTVHQISTGKDQTIDAHGGCFATVTLPNQTTPSTLLCFARSDGSGVTFVGKLKRLFFIFFSY